MTTSWEAKGHHVTGSGIKFAVYSAHKYKSYEYPDPDLAELIAGFVGLLVQELKMLEMLRNSSPRREENVMSNPWIVKRRKSRANLGPEHAYRYRVARGDKYTEIIATIEPLVGENVEANAHLIAAAPEMLEVLDDVEDFLLDMKMQNLRNLLAKVRTARTKATKRGRVNQ